MNFNLLLLFFLLNFLSIFFNTCTQYFFSFGKYNGKDFSNKEFINIFFNISYLTSFHKIINDNFKKNYFLTKFLQKIVARNRLWSKNSDISYISSFKPSLVVLISIFLYIQNWAFIYKTKEHFYFTFLFL